MARLVHAAAGRCDGLHFGTYDYTAALGIAAAHQAMDHPVADHAKNAMLLASAGTGVPVSDGSTNLLPVGSADQVRAGWARHFRLVGRSLERGLYQGWACTQPSCRPVSWPPSCSSGPGWTRPGRGCATTSPAPAAPSSTSRPPRGHSPASCVAACTAAR